MADKADRRDVQIEPGDLEQIAGGTRPGDAKIHQWTDLDKLAEIREQFHRKHGHGEA